MKNALGYEDLPATSTLFWDDVRYNDEDGDFRIDRIIIKNERLQTGPGLQRIYSKLLRKLKQPRIHRIWQERW